MHARITSLAACLALTTSLGAVACAQTTEGAVEIRMQPGARPVIGAQINGVEGLFILDTGAQGGLVYDSFAARAGGSFDGSTVRLGSPLGGTPFEARMMTADSVQIGGLELGPLNLVSIPDDAMPLPQDTIGVLSTNVLSSSRVEIDFGAWTLRIGDHAGAPVAAWTDRAPRARLLEAEIEIGDLMIDAHLDTGSPGSILLPLSYAQALGLADEIEETGQMRTVDATRSIFSAPYSGEVRVAGIVIPVSRLAFADVPVANIGSAALGHLTLVLDAGGQRYGFLPSASPREIAPPARPVPAAAEDRR